MKKIEHIKRLFRKTWQSLFDNMGRKLIGLFLVVGIVFSVCIIWKAISIDEPEWSAIAGSMAVLTAIIAPWSALIITWRQIDFENPHLFLQLDTSRRHGHTQIDLKNKGNMILDCCLILSRV